MRSSFRYLVLPALALGIVMAFSPAALAVGPTCDMASCKAMKAADCDPADCIPCDLCPDDCKDACPGGYVTCNAASMDCRTLTQTATTAAVKPVETKACGASSSTCCKAVAQVEVESPKSAK
ncbi:MAG: hypothetical protein AB1752_06715 [Candidatus Zixiibacteriota bacterium]